MIDTRVAIVGTGPGGATCALFLQQQGIDCVLIERTSFPRFHIGESMTGECGNVVRALGLEEALHECCDHQVKHGVWVYGPNGKNNFWIPVMARVDGELRDSSTWQVRRSEFDALLRDSAVERGVPVIQGRATDVIREEGRICGVTVELDEGSTETVRADVVVDASGQATFLSNIGVLGAKDRGNYDKQLALYTHVKGARRDEGEAQGNTLIFYQKPNHWAWFIPIDDEVTSVGVVVPSEYFKSTGESREDFLKREMAELNSALSERMTDVEFVEEVRGASNYSYHIPEFTGPGYLCVGDSHRFIDPVFSFGLHFAMWEGRFAADAIGKFLSGETADRENPFLEYQEKAEQGQDTIQLMLDTFWTNPFAFAVFAHSRYPEDFIDMFAGRVWMDEPSPGFKALIEVNEAAAARAGATSPA